MYPCIIEKKDLVELVLQTNDDKAESRRPAPNLPPSRSWEDTTIRVSDQVNLPLTHYYHGFAVVLAPVSASKLSIRGKQHFTSI